MRRIVLGVCLPINRLSHLPVLSAFSVDVTVGTLFRAACTPKSPGIVGQRSERCTNGVYCNYHHLPLSIVRSTVGGWLGGKKWKLQALIQAS